MSCPVGLGLGVLLVTGATPQCFGHYLCQGTLTFLIELFAEASPAPVEVTFGSFLNAVLLFPWGGKGRLL